MPGVAEAVGSAATPEPTAAQDAIVGPAAAKAEVPEPTAARDAIAGPPVVEAAAVPESAAAGDAIAGRTAAEAARSAAVGGIESLPGAEVPAQRSSAADGRPAAEEGRLSGDSRHADPRNTVAGAPQLAESDVVVALTSLEQRESNNHDVGAVEGVGAESPGGGISGSERSAAEEPDKDGPAADTPTAIDTAASRPDAKESAADGSAAGDAVTGGSAVDGPPAGDAVTGEAAVDEADAGKAADGRGDTDRANGDEADEAPPQRAARPVVKVTGDRVGERPLRVVERALRSQPGRGADGWRGERVVVVPGGHRPGKPDQLQRDRARARLPVEGARRIVVLGCTRGAGQTTTVLLAGDMLASLRGQPVAVLDLNPGRGSLTEQAAAIPGLVQGSADTVARVRDAGWRSAARRRTRGYRTGAAGHQRQRGGGRGRRRGAHPGPGRGAVPADDRGPGGELRARGRWMWRISC